MRTLAALSGGVDSAVAAALLLREGRQVVGVHLRTGVEADGAAAGAGRSCCGVEDARDARRVASRLGIPFYVVDVREAFARILDAFVAGYAGGRTPNPCVDCNRDVKFGRLREIAAGLGCDAVATGHYARRARGPEGRRRLLRAADRQKDQTYVLYALDQEQLAAARFPLGSLEKTDVRREAAALGLSVAAKPDSQELCFAPGGDYRRFLRERAPHTMAPGAVVDEDGRVIGRHDGVAGYTVGQRRRLPPAGSPRYVTRLDADAARVHVAPRRGACRRTVRVGRCNWIEVQEPPPGTRIPVEARIRHAAPPEAALLEVTEPGRAEVRFERPAFAPAPGQALVAYVGEAVLCGGEIEAEADGPRRAARTAEPGPMGGSG